MEHNIEGDIRECIEVANGDYNLSHLDEPMLKFYNEIVAKAKAFNEILNVDLEQHEIIVHGLVEDVVNKYMEDTNNE